MMSYLKMGVKVLAPAMLEPADTVLLNGSTMQPGGGVVQTKKRQDAIVLH